MFIRLYGQENLSLIKAIWEEQVGQWKESFYKPTKYCVEMGGYDSNGPEFLPNEMPIFQILYVVVQIW